MNCAEQNPKYDSKAGNGMTGKSLVIHLLFRYLFATFVPIVALLLPSCVQELARPTDSQKKDVSPPFSTISKGAFSGCTNKQNLVVKTPEEWKELWKKHTSIRKPQTPTPKVDFVKEMILAVFSGQKPTGGFAVEIVRVEKAKNELKVYFRETVPPPDAGVPEVFTQPYHIIEMEKSDLPVIFTEEGVEDE